MKTVVIDYLINGINAGTVSNYNPVTGQTFNPVRSPLTNQDINSYKSEVPAIKEEFYAIAKNLLAKAGFTFDRSLWTWHYEQPNPYQFNLWARITWTDGNDEGKAAFMSYIKQTGFQEFTHRTLKSYS